MHSVVTSKKMKDGMGAVCNLAHHLLRVFYTQRWREDH